LVLVREEPPNFGFAKVAIYLTDGALSHEAFRIGVNYLCGELFCRDEKI